MKLLIVDNDYLMKQSFSVLLSYSDGITISGFATNGAKAFEMCKVRQPDAILMDIRVPGLDSITAIRLIKKEYPHIRILIFTALRNKSAIQQALMAGADGYMRKTGDISSIVGKLHSLCAK